MNKREARFQVVFTNYLKEMNKKKFYGSFELKRTITDSISFKALKPHQESGLSVIGKQGLVWKLSDADPREKPCDCISTPPLPPYVVIKFKKLATIISLGDLLKEEETGAKTLTLQRAKDIAKYIITY